jgi:hypothetical protein
MKCMQLDNANNNNMNIHLRTLARTSSSRDDGSDVDNGLLRLRFCVYTPPPAPRPLPLRDIVVTDGDGRSGGGGALGALLVNHGNVMMMVIGDYEGEEFGSDFGSISIFVRIDFHLFGPISIICSDRFTSYKPIRFTTNRSD